MEKWTNRLNEYVYERLWTDGLNRDVYERLANCRSLKSDIEKWTIVNKVDKKWWKN